jgi:hypothetical protein
VVVAVQDDARSGPLVGVVLAAGRSRALPGSGCAPAAEAATASLRGPVAATSDPVLADLATDAAPFNHPLVRRSIAPQRRATAAHGLVAPQGSGVLS